MAASGNLALDVVSRYEGLEQRLYRAWSAVAALLRASTLTERYPRGDVVVIRSYPWKWEPLPAGNEPIAETAANEANHWLEESRRAVRLNEPDREDELVKSANVITRAIDRTPRSDGPISNNMTKVMGQTEGRIDPRRPQVTDVADVGWSDGVVN
jgi:hypothetical protein